MADRDPGDIKKVARCPGEGWEEILAADAIQPPEFMAKDQYQYLGSEALDAKRWIDPAFFQQEIEKMWPNVWQMAAREEEMPEVGDYVTYDNAGRSYLLVRQDDGSIRAFHNVCLHRGRKLMTESGFADQFYCPFHGFAWNIDGSIKNIPCKWDFSHCTDKKMQLPEASVGRWGGYIFVRDSAEGPTLEEWLAPLPDYFKQWKHEECYTAAWVGKVVKANWKIVMEAFMESYHAYATHPQLMPFMGDANAAYHVLSDTVNVNYTPFGTMSPHVAGADKTEQWIIDEFVKYNGRSADNYDESKGDISVPAGETARQALAAAMRETSAKLFKRDYSETSDSELLDALVYNVFPNWALWGGFMPNIVYRWRPWNDHEHTLMEVRVLVRVAPGEDMPRAAPFHLLTDDEAWTAASEMGVLGGVVQQDMDNMELVHEGLKVSKNGLVELGDYQEIRIRHFHQTLDTYLKA